MKIKIILTAIFIIFAFWCITTNIRYFVQQNKIITERQNQPPKSTIPLNDLFKAQISQYKHRVDSINREINLQYNYENEVIACVYPQHSILSQIPYYGMTNGKKAFIYSLHFKDLRQIRLIVKTPYSYLGIDQNGRWYKMENLNEKSPLQ